MITDDLAQILAEHRSWSEVCCSDTEGWHYECSCGQNLPTNEGHDEAWEDLAAHQAEVIVAAGWVKGREEFGVHDGEDVDEIEPSTRGWAERVAAADNAYLRRNGMEGESIVVRRYVTDWEEA